MKQDVTFLIPIFNLKDQRLSNFKYLINSLLNLDYPILVVEQKKCSKKTNAETICSIHKKNITYKNIISESDLIEKSKLINFGSKHIKTKYIWMTDADALLKYDWILNNIEFDADVIQPYNISKKITKYESEKILLSNKINISFNIEEDGFQNYISIPFGFSCIYSKESLKKLGWFDEKFVGWGHEDADISIRLYNRHDIKFKIVHTEAVHLWHPETGSADSINENKIINNNILIKNNGKKSIKEFQNKHKELIKNPKCSIVTLFRGDRSLLDNINSYIKSETICIDNEVIWVINSENKKFISEVYKKAQEHKDIRIILNKEFKNITSNYFDYRHEFIGNLYSDIFQNYSKSNYIITLEDDMIPPEGGFNHLIDYALKNPNKIGAIGGLYKSKSNKAKANISLQKTLKDKNSNYILSNYERVKNTGIIECSSIGGGFTLWNMEVLDNFDRISINRDSNNIPKGWDWVLSENILRSNRKLLTNTDLIVEHLI